MAFSFWTVAGAAFAIRLLFIAVYSYVFPDHWSKPDFEGWELGRIAVNLYEGRGFSSPFSADSQPTAWLSPLIPALWAAIMKLMREASGRTELAITVLQAFASSLSAALYIVIFQRVAPNPPRRIAIVYAVAVVFWPESLLRLTFLWYYVWQELSVAVLVWFGIRWSERRTWRAAVALGTAGGLTALMNVTPIPLFAIALAVPVFASRNRIVLGRALLGGLVALLIVTPWLVRNRAVFGVFVPLRGNIGVELLQGNNPDGSVRQRADSLHPYNTPSEFDRYRKLGEVQYNRDAAARAFAWIRRHPVDAAAKVVQRIYVVWLTDLTDRWSWDRNKKWWQVRYNLVLQLTTIFSALIPLAAAIAGVVRAGFHAIPHRWLLFAPLLVPFPHYFTQVDDAYVAFVRLCLLLIAAVAFSIPGAPFKRQVTNDRGACSPG